MAMLLRDKTAPAEEFMSLFGAALSRILIYKNRIRCYFYGFF